MLPGRWAKLAAVACAKQFQISCHKSRRALSPLLSWNYATQEAAYGRRNHGGPLSIPLSGGCTREITMQGMALSIPSPANASSPATTTLLPFDPQSSSPFAAVFQAALKGVGNNGKLPLAGKTQDSSREPASTTGTGNNMFGPLPQGMVAAAFVPIVPGPSLSVVAAPVPIAPIVPNSATTQGAAAVSNPLSLEAMTKLDRNTGQARGTEQGPPASSTPLPSAAMTRLAMTTVQARDTLTGQAVPTLAYASLSLAE